MLVVQLSFCWLFLKEPRGWGTPTAYVGGRRVQKSESQFKVEGCVLNRSSCQVEGCVLFFYFCGTRSFTTHEDWKPPFARMCMVRSTGIDLDPAAFLKSFYHRLSPCTCLLPRLLCFSHFPPLSLSGRVHSPPGQLLQVHGGAGNGLPGPLLV